MACCGSCQAGGKCEGEGCINAKKSPPNHIKPIKTYKWKYGFTLPLCDIAESITVKGTKKSSYFKMKGSSSPYHGLGSPARSGSAWERQSPIFTKPYFERRQMSQLCRTGGDRIQ